MKTLIYKHYTFIIVIAAVLSVISIYIINTYSTGFFGGFVAGVLSAIAIGLILIPRRKFLK